MEEGRDLRGGGSRDGWLTLEDNDPIGQVRRHDKIVLDDERGLLSVEDEPGEYHTMITMSTILSISEGGK